MYIYTLTLKAKTQWQCKQTVIICVIAGGRGSDVLLSLTARVETAAQCPELCESQWGKLTVISEFTCILVCFLASLGFFCFAVPIRTLRKNITYISIQQEVEQSGWRTSCDLNRLPVGPDSRSTARFTGFLKSASSRFERERETALFIHLYCMCVGAAFVFFSVCKLNIYSFTATQRPRGGGGQRPELTETAA